MRSIIILGIVLLSTYASAQDTFYGDQINKEGIQSSSLIKTSLENKDVASLKLKGEILATCAKKGCWMTIKLDNGEEMRVTFKDYGFFVPTSGMEGNSTIIEGEVKKEITDIETLKHFAEDAGKSEEEIALITSPKEEYTFVANGVIIAAKGK